MGSSDVGESRIQFPSVQQEPQCREERGVCTQTSGQPRSCFPLLTLKQEHGVGKHLSADFSPGE